MSGHGPEAAAEDDHERASHRPDGLDASRFDELDVTVLRWFVAVAEQLHFARAAQSLGIARQRLSRAVIDLEEELGTKLFVPGAQPTQLSDQGLELLEAAREIVAAAADADTGVSAQDGDRLRVGFVPGVTVTKWERIWAARYPDIRLELVPIPMREQESALREGGVDMCFVRLPIERAGLSIIPLYREVPVVVVPKDHPLSVFDQVGMAELADERMQDASDLDDAEMTMEMVAAVSGAAIVPHSIARLHHRKDLVYLTMTGVPDTEIVLAWPTEATTELIEEFVGVVRGRSERTTRSPSGQSNDKQRKGAARSSGAKSVKHAGAKQSGAKAGGKKPAGAAKGKQGAPKPGKRRGR
ncbi:LysR family transcriptional regulator [Nocardia jejuensis]|uniref:LysR family transcriptional regulator n=1 Tax=Nocardia jejuensis TaxID=328049 RepID=UPI0009FDB1DF|nr:LysR family transcriptional regulator [Nocardia jejuensis]